MKMTINTTLSLLFLLLTPSLSAQDNKMEAFVNMNLSTNSKVGETIDTKLYKFIQNGTTSKENDTTVVSYLFVEGQGEYVLRVQNSAIASISYNGKSEIFHYSAAYDDWTPEKSSKILNEAVKGINNLKPVTDNNVVEGYLPSEVNSLQSWISDEMMAPHELKRVQEYRQKKYDDFLDKYLPQQEVINAVQKRIDDADEELAHIQNKKIHSDYRKLHSEKLKAVELMKVLERKIELTYLIADKLLAGEKLNETELAKELENLLAEKK